MTTPTTTAAFFAWWRATQRHAWQRVAEDTDADACLDAALTTLASRPSGDFVVLAADRHPDQPAARQPRGKRRL